MLGALYIAGLGAITQTGRSDVSSASIKELDHLSVPPFGNGLP
jgi:hypothetical protein